MTNIAGIQTIQFAIRLGNMALSRKSFGHSSLKRPKEKSQPTQKKNTLDRDGDRPRLGRGQDTESFYTTPPKKHNYPNEWANIWKICINIKTNS